MLGLLIKNRYLVLGLFASLFLVASGFWIYNKGLNSCTINQLAISLNETHGALKDKENADEIVNKAPDIDVLLSRLGILRADSDR